MMRFGLFVLMSGLILASGADDAFEKGMRYARNGQWAEARSAFLQGRALAPQETRFALELAGVAFRQGDRPRAIEELRRVLAIDPRDSYANEALGDLYLLEGRFDAALVYWNRIGKPKIHEVIVPEEFRRAVDASSGDILTTESALETSANFGRLGLSSPRMELVPAAADEFDLVVHVADPSVAGRNLPGWIAGVASGLPYETLNLAFRPGRDWIETIGTTLRWDSNKRLAGIRASGLFAGNPELRYLFEADARDENWNLRAAPLAPFRFSGTSAGVQIEAGLTGRLRWTNGIVLSNVHYGSAPPLPEFVTGIETKGTSSVTYQALRSASERFGLTLNGGAQFGMFAQPFAKFQAGADARWTPSERAAIDLHAGVSAGTSAGALPFNEFYTLGMSRDNDLWIRGHVAEFDGRKGNGPMGGRYELAQLDAFKTVYRNGFVHLELGPFLDSGQVAGPFGSRGWLLDAGVESHLRVLHSATLIGIFGHDTIHGGNVVFTAIRAGG